MGLKVLKIKGLGKIFVIYASFCAPYLACFSKGCIRKKLIFKNFPTKFNLRV